MDFIFSLVVLRVPEFKVTDLADEPGCIQVQDAHNRVAIVGTPESLAQLADALRDAVRQHTLSSLAEKLNRAGAKTA